MIKSRLSVLSCAVLLACLLSCSTGRNSYAPKNLRRLLPAIDLKEDSVNAMMYDYAYCKLSKEAHYDVYYDSTAKKYVGKRMLEIYVFARNNTVKYKTLLVKNNIDSLGILAIVNDLQNQYDSIASKTNQTDTLVPNKSLDVVLYEGLIRVNLNGLIYMFDEGMKYMGIPFDEGLYPNVIAFRYDPEQNKLFRITNNGFWHSSATSLSRLSTMPFEFLATPQDFTAYPLKKILDAKAVAVTHWPPFRRWQARLDSVNKGLREPERVE